MNDIDNNSKYIEMLYFFLDGLYIGEKQLFINVYNKLIKCGWEPDIDFVLEYSDYSHLTDKQLIDICERYTDDQIRSRLNECFCHDNVIEHFSHHIKKIDLFCYILKRFTTKEALLTKMTIYLLVIYNLIDSLAEVSIDHEDQCLGILDFLFGKGIPIDLKYPYEFAFEEPVICDLTLLSHLVLFYTEAKDWFLFKSECKEIPEIHSICFQSIVEFFISKGADLSFSIKAVDKTVLEVMKEHKSSFSKPAILELLAE